MSGSLIASKLIEQASDNEVNKDKATINGICSSLRVGGSLAVVTLWCGVVEEKRLVVDEAGRVVGGNGYLEGLEAFSDRIRGIIEGGQDVHILDEPDLLGRFDRAIIEVLRPKVRLLVFGAGHVGQAVANVAAVVGYDVVVFDDREEFLRGERFLGGMVEFDCGDYSELVGRVRINSRTAVVIVTRGHQYDEICLKGVLRSGAAYVGMIGSKRRVVSVFKRLVAEGYAEQELGKVFAPIGLPIGARSPQEIAVSIVAQIIEVMNKR